MTTRLKDERLLLSPPGDDILEHIEYIKMNQAELADRLGKTPSKVHDLITGKEPITNTTALQLEKVLGIEASYWLNRESRYREKLARLEQAKSLAYAKDWVALQPYKELRKSGYIKAEKPGADMVAETLEFYGVINPERWQTRYVDEFISARFRKSAAHQTSLSSMGAWLRMGEIEMQKLKLADYDAGLFKKALKDIKVLAQQHPDDFSQQLQKHCALAGVAVIYTTCLPKAPFSGATRWFRSNPLIQLTARYKTNDHFWFTFFHKAGHVLLHGRKEVFLEEFEGFDLHKGKEEEANQFAMKWLLPQKAIEELPIEIRDEDIIDLAERYSTHPGIVVGRLQNLGILSFKKGNKYKVNVRI